MSGKSLLFSMAWLGLAEAFGGHTGGAVADDFQFAARSTGCTRDIKECADGSTVVRDPSNDCEFESCPITMCTRDIKICADGSNVVRDPKNNCEFESCPTTGGCPKDIKICADGSNVVRDPNNNCEFESCPTPAVCTLDIKICADGSNVVRDPSNNCEFGSCPTTGGCTRDIRICADGSNVVRDPNNNCEFESCPTPAGCTRDIKICADGSSVVRDPNNDCEFESCPTTDASGCGSLKYQNCLENQEGCMWKDKTCQEGPCSMRNGEEWMCRAHERCQYNKKTKVCKEKAEVKSPDAADTCASKNYQDCLADKTLGCIFADKKCSVGSCSILKEWMCKAHAHCKYGKGKKVCMERDWFVKPATEADTTTCEGCVASGLAWQGSCQQPINGMECPIMDIGCYTTAESCKSYYEVVEATKTCPMSGSDCATCVGTSGCAWSTYSGGACIAAANAWTGDIVRNVDQCPQTISIGMLEPITLQIDTSTCEGCVASGLAWQGSCQQPINGMKCPIMDVGCYTTAESCQSYYEVDEATKRCPMSSSDCATCIGTSGCAWSTYSGGACIAAANAWSGDIVYNLEQCPMTMVWEPIVSNSLVSNSLSFEPVVSNSLSFGGR